MRARAASTSIQASAPSSKGIVKSSRNLAGPSWKSPGSFQGEKAWSSSDGTIREGDWCVA
jgi:hypothetical protein